MGKRIGVGEGEEESGLLIFCALTQRPRVFGECWGVGRRKGNAGADTLSHYYVQEVEVMSLNLESFRTENLFKFPDKKATKLTV